MVLFGGYCDEKLFQGKILDGGVDTQIIDGSTTLSARYMLQGRDESGAECKIFIENNAVFHQEEDIATTPYIITDSENLKWLERARLQGELRHDENGLVIAIMQLE